MSISNLDLIYIGALPPHPGGAGISTSQLISGIARRGACVRALSPITRDVEAQAQIFSQEHPELNIQRYIVPFFHMAGYIPMSEEYIEAQYAQLQERAAALVAARKPNLLLAAHETWAIYVQRLARIYDIPAVLWTRGSPTTDLINGWYEPALAERTLANYRGFAMIITPAPHMTQGLEHLGLKNVRTIWNAIDLEQFAPRPKPSSLMRELELQSEQLVVALFGNLTTRKRPQDFARAALLALERAPHLVFLVVGSGSEMDSLRQMVHAADADNNFRIVERVAYERMPDLFRLADIVVSTSEAEGMSRVYLETMASARVLIASDIPAARDVVRDRETGLLFPPSDTARLAELILETGADPALRARIAENARQYVQAHSLAHAVDAYCAALEPFAVGNCSFPESAAP